MSTFQSVCLGAEKLPPTVAGMKRWGLRGASVSHEKKHDTGAKVT